MSRALKGRSEPGGDRGPATTYRHFGVGVEAIPTDGCLIKYLWVKYTEVPGG